ncbi:unnamed protein product [Vitrella brassicaformis CCMP3155]|uniref:Uncharacterized protein n=1 Tax=Vitrella brassicaformis (strain CCMP3155) TaxID=1169540 RepID=A0A0G4G3G6_VITBC|nr:unnamed protein product [Vitrella brassicaformis CCMP3155]|eukprot:CEM22824.1 unnamed protein product [Vitrella brassicaformis CCMP3155]
MESWDVKEQRFRSLLRQLGHGNQQAVSSATAMFQDYDNFRNLASVWQQELDAAIGGAECGSQEGNAKIYEFFSVMSGAFLGDRIGFLKGHFAGDAAGGAAGAAGGGIMENLLKKLRDRYALTPLLHALVEEWNSRGYFSDKDIAAFRRALAPPARQANPSAAALSSSTLLRGSSGHLNGSAVSGRPQAGKRGIEDHQRPTDGSAFGSDGDVASLKRMTEMQERILVKQLKRREMEMQGDMQKAGRMIQGEYEERVKLLKEIPPLQERLEGVVKKRVAQLRNAALARKAIEKAIDKQKESQGG